MAAPKRKRTKKPEPSEIEITDKTTLWEIRFHPSGNPAAMRTRYVLAEEPEDALQKARKHIDAKPYNVVLLVERVCEPVDIVW